MENLHPLNLKTKGANSVSGRASKEAFEKIVSSAEHSELAMKAAKRMRRTKYKEKTGHKVCHHLLEMIRESSESQPAPRTARRYHGLKESLRHGLIAEVPQGMLQSNVSGTGDATQLNPANDRQFSLAF